MVSKWVPLKSGGKAVPFRLDFLLTKDDLIRVLCYWQKDWTPQFAEPLPEMTWAYANQEVRNMLRYTGWESFVFWSDGLKEENAKVIWAWAEETIDRVYPQ